MTAKLTLWIRGVYFIHEDISLPPWAAAMDFEGNVSSRERWIQHKREQMRERYFRSILKHGQDHFFTLDVASDPDGRPFQSSLLTI